jgi:hypothetical protein
MYAWNGIRTHDPSVRASEDRTATVVGSLSLTEYVIP